MQSKFRCAEAVAQLAVKRYKHAARKLVEVRTGTGHLAMCCVALAAMPMQDFVQALVVQTCRSALTQTALSARCCALLLKDMAWCNHLSQSRGCKRRLARDLMQPTSRQGVQRSAQQSSGLMKFVCLNRYHCCKRRLVRNRSECAGQPRHGQHLRRGAQRAGRGHVGRAVRAGDLLSQGAQDAGH